MPLGDLEFRLRWLPTLVLGIAVPVFVALGFWQLDRAQQKRERAETLIAREEMPTYDLLTPVAEAEELRFRKLRAQGRFDEEGQIFVENRREGSRIGFHVITPLVIEGSDRRVLVNRGWIPAGPDADPTPAPVPAQVVTVTGRAHLPSPPAIVLQNASEAAQKWGRRWPYLTVDIYRSRAAYPVAPVVILQDPNVPHGFVRNWPRELPEEGMHIGYAIQWFAFALIALVLWLRFNLTRPSTAETEA